MYQVFEEEEFFPTVQQAAATSTIMRKTANKVVKLNSPKPRSAAKSRRWTKWKLDGDVSLLGWSDGEPEDADDNMLCQVGSAQDDKVAGKKGRWVDGVVDSGVVASVAKRGTFPGKITASPMSRAKKGYKSASRHRIPNAG